MTAETVMGIDPGSKRIGLAVGNTVTRTAQPLAVLSAQHFLEELQPHLQAWQPARFVIGLPVNTQGQATHGTQIAQRLGRRLQTHTRLPVEWVDERYSSAVAQSTAPEKSGKMLDAYAATLILQQYLNDVDS